MNESLLENLVGEGKKFKTTEDLAKGKNESDAYISTLESQLDLMRSDMETLRTENIAKAKLEDLLDQWQSRQKQLPDPEPKVEAKAPSKDEYLSLIDARVEERETRKRHAENYDSVKQKLKEHYGEQYASALSSQMKDLGISEDFLNHTARNNPKALLKMLGIEDQPISRDVFRSPPTSQVRPGIRSLEEKRDWAWYQKLKEENPKKYYSRETNIQMHKDALELGSSFETGDFNKYEKDFRIKY